MEKTPGELKELIGQVQQVLGLNLCNEYQHALTVTNNCVPVHPPARPA